MRCGCPSVCLSVQSIDSNSDRAAGLLLSSGVGIRYRSISAARARAVMSRAEVRGSTQTINPFRLSEMAKSHLDSESESATSTCNLMSTYNNQKEDEKFTQTGRPMKLNKQLTDK